MQAQNTFDRYPQSNEAGFEIEGIRKSKLCTRRDANGSSSPTPQSLDDMEQFYIQFEAREQTSPDTWFNEDHSKYFENIEDIQEIADAITAIGITPHEPENFGEEPSSSRLTRRKAEAERRISSASDATGMDDVLALLASGLQSPPRSPRRSSPRMRSPTVRSSPTPRDADLRGSPVMALSPTSRVRSPKPQRRQSIDQENFSIPPSPKGGRKSSQSSLNGENMAKKVVGSRRNSFDPNSFPLSPTTNGRNSITEMPLF